MGKIAKEGMGIDELVKMAVPICQQAEQECPRTGPGRRPEIPDWVMTVLILVVVAKRRKTKSAQYRFLKSHQAELSRWMGTSRFPSRSTYFSRYRRAYKLLQFALRIQSLLEAEAGHIQLRCVAVDKSLIPTCGAKWANAQKVKGRLPAGADIESAWTFSPYHGWVLGYGYEVVVTAQRQGIVWPILASVEPANVSERTTFPRKIEQLPPQIRYVLADKGYDSQDLATAVEVTRSAGHACRQRRFVCPLQERHNVGQAKQTWNQTHRRRQRWERRQKRRLYMQTKFAKRLFSRRSRTVEPFNEWFKSLFELNEKAWHRGLGNNRTQILAALLVYQFFLRYNQHHNRPNAQVRGILDAL
jgi:hypothetical protein